MSWSTRWENRNRLFYLTSSKIKSRSLRRWINVINIIILLRDKIIIACLKWIRRRMYSSLWRELISIVISQLSICAVLLATSITTSSDEIMLFSISILSRKSSTRWISRLTHVNTSLLKLSISDKEIEAIMYLSILYFVTLTFRTRREKNIFETLCSDNSDLIQSLSARLTS